MNTVYLFFEDENITIPLYDYDKELFTNLVKSNMGRWVQNEKHYRLSRSKYERNTMKAIAAGRPYVEVDKQADSPVTVHGFILNENLEAVEIEPIIEAAPIVYPGMAAPPGELPKQFSDFWQDKLEIEMRSRKFSRHTRIAYTANNQALCQWLQKKPEAVTSDDIKRYLAYMEKTRRHAAATLNSTLSAFKFFYLNVIKKDIANDQRRPRQDKRLPVVLSKAEVKKIIEGEANIKHRLLLMIAYASGLRVSEIVNLRREDLDLSRKVIRIVAGKGRKDRYTILSQTTIAELSRYYTQHRITDLLFPGADPAKQLHIRTAQHIFQHALKKADIGKKASIHSLRHTFATHLLESGYDICKIKELLGHASVRTTERYLQMARRKVLKIISPLDTIDDADDDAEEDYFFPENR